jgi:Ca-activated chloride channel family protein
VEFRDPIFLVLVLLAPLVFFWSSRLPARVRFSHLSALDAAPKSLRVRMAKLPALLLAVAAVCLAIAIARPRTGDATTVVSGEGIAIVMAVDRSGSMSALDFQGEDGATSRLEAVKDVFRQFVTGGAAGAGRPDDLIGLVAFGTYADGLCPLTLDHANLVAILDDLDIAKAQSEQGTAVGEGLGLAIERLLGVENAASRVVVLLTDGVSNAGVLDPLPAAELASDHGIRVYTIGVGQRGYAPIPIPGPDGRIRLRRVFVETDEAALQQIAERTGGRFFRAEDTEALEGVYAEIDRLEKSQIVETRYLRYREHYGILAAAAFVLIFAAALAAATVLRRLP